MFNLGSINIVEQQGTAKMPQEAASAWSAFDTNMVGASYKPMDYIGTQIVKGTNYYFIAEQTLILATPQRHIVLVIVNEFEGNYTIKGIEQII